MEYITKEQFVSHVPKEYHQYINFDGLDSNGEDEGRDLRYFLCLKDGYEFASNPGCGTDTFGSWKELKELLSEIREEN